MESTAVAETVIGKKAQHQRGSAMAGAVFTIGFLLTGLIGVTQKAPRPVPANAAVGEFSAHRALHHVEQIARQPHPPGTAEHVQVRNYIQQQLSAMGLNPQIEAQTVVNSDFSKRIGILISAGRPENIRATITGTKSTKTILVAAHYDSVATGPGASDNASAVAAALETIRALRAGPPLQNDIAFLFTDGEESGLLGAKAFAENSKELANIGMVLNFDARGTSGQDLMFEMGPESGRLLQEFAHVAPYPSASSLGYEIYKHLPNDTDFTAFKRAGIPGLNFAFLNGYAYYHTARDDVRNVDSRTMQQMGSNMLALVRCFASQNLANIKGPDMVFFNIPGWILVRYSIAWVKPLAALTVLLFCVALNVAVRRRQITYRGIAFGVGVVLLSAFAAFAGVTLSWAGLVLFVHPGYRQIAGGNSYTPAVYIAALSSLGVAVIAAIYGWALRRSSMFSLSMGAATVWASLLILSAFMFPGASYVLTWPLLFFSIASAFQMTRQTAGRDEERGTDYKQIALGFLGSIPALLIVMPVLYLIFVGLTVLASGIAAIFIALLFGLLVPQFPAMHREKPKMLASVALLIAMSLLIAGAFISGFNERHPQPDSLMYGFDPDKNVAMWISFDRSPDVWTRQFVPANAGNQKLSEYFPWTERKFRVANAPVVQLAPPVIDVLQDQTSAGVRTLKLRLRSQRHAPELAVSSSFGSRVTGASVDGQAVGTIEKMAPVLQKRNVWGFDYTGLPDQGIDLVLEMSPGPIQITFIDVSYGLPEVLAQLLPSRPASMVAHPIPINDKTYVTVTRAF
jgi:hypothetical protein